jgi:hypothetical protein
VCSSPSAADTPSPARYPSPPSDFPLTPTGPTTTPAPIGGPLGGPLGDLSANRHATHTPAAIPAADDNPFSSSPHPGPSNPFGPPAHSHGSQAPTSPATDPYRFPAVTTAPLAQRFSDPPSGEGAAGGSAAGPSRGFRPGTDAASTYAAASLLSNSVTVHSPRKAVAPSRLPGAFRSPRPTPAAC